MIVSDLHFLSTEKELLTSKRKLPHWEQDGAAYFVTWRLGDSIPLPVIEKWKRERDLWLLHHPKPWSPEREMEFHKRFSARLDAWMDKGKGSCVLRQPACGNLMAQSLLFFDNVRYQMYTFVVMPNHVHALFSMREGYPLKKTVGSWKGYSSREINKLLHRSGPLWQEESWDRMVRSEPHFWKCREYILDNPAKARLSPGSYILYDDV